MSKFKTIDSFFKRKEANISERNTPLDFNAETSNPNECHLKSLKVEDEEHPFESLIAEMQETHSKSSLLVKTSINVVRWLSFQGCAFGNHDETLDSNNQGNFLEMIKMLASYNDKLASVVLENVSKSAKYTSHTIQKEILQVIASKVRDKIREDIGDSRFCIIVDEAQDEFEREQMAIVLRFVDKDGFIQKLFFALVHVKDTSALTLKNEISDVLSRYRLDIQNIHGQGYNGASNMRGEWKGLQALFLNDCPCAYYIHCFAHRLQLASVAASREVISVHLFFTNLNFIINVVSDSCKCHDQLQVHATQIAHMRAIGELEIGNDANQIGTLKQADDSHWGSHFNSICSLIRMFDATCTMLEDVGREGDTYSLRGDVNVAYKMLTSFKFIFILHLMKEIMSITDVLCQVLQQKSQDILNIIHSVSIAKKLLQKLRDDGWDNLLENIVSFSKKYEIDIPDFSARYIEGRGRNQKKHITVEHYYHFDIFNATIDFQLQELDSWFSEKAMELLTLSSALDPKDAYKSFKIDDICILAEKYYPLDFSEHEKMNLRYQLRYFEFDVLTDPTLQNLSSIAELCQGLTKTKKSRTYYLIDRLIRLVLTLPVFTVTTERTFSAMEIVNTQLRNKMEDDFLANSLVLYIEREIAESFDSDSIFDDFVLLKDHKVLL